PPPFTTPRGHTRWQVLSRGLGDVYKRQPQAAFSQLQLYCEKNNLELPNKDTCGKAFKDAKYYFDNFNSK
ncbi:hypothetical protein, partial [Acinetobacter baumannii]|uniref:hypothetical protein n=1 Tax=Acinetobacter baumannii TaxID=470 RepID=UPI003AFA3E07